MSKSSGYSVMVLTSKDTETMLKLGGTQSWVMDADKARKADYIVCVRNTKKSPGGLSLKNRQRHGIGLLVGRISNVVPAFGYPGRWLIEFDEYAEIDKPHLWPKKLRNPIHYISTSQLTTEYGIDFDKLDFKKTPPRDEAFCADYVDPGYKSKESKTASPSASAETESGLSIQEAKEGLAERYDVPIENIEIIIKW